jgi:phosphate:Na+ symporter
VDIGSIVQLLGGTGLFLYSMKIMCGSIQKATGSSMQTALAFMTKNRFAGFFTGFGATAVIQSSTATTVMVVSFVSAGMLSLVQSIGVIMGANVGTTLTAWIIAILGFKVNISAFAFPAIALGIPFLFLKKLRKENLGEFLVGFGLLFLSLLYIKESMPGLDADSQALKDVLDAVSGGGIVSRIAFVCAGMVFSVLLQSSTATIAITQTMTFQGWINFETAALIILGTTIGTTFTAQIAAIGSNMEARRAAMVHTLFNVFCVIWVLSIFGVVMHFIGSFFPVPLSEPGVHTATGLALFHTFVALCNTSILIWFVPQIARVVKWMLPDRRAQLDDGRYRLQYNAASWGEAPDAGVMLLWQEVQKMAFIVEGMLRKFISRFHSAGQAVGDITEEFALTEKRIHLMRAELLRFIGECSRYNLSDSNRAKTSHQIYVIEKLESISDVCALLAILEKKRHARLSISSEKGIFQRLKKQLFKSSAQTPQDIAEEAKPYTTLVADFFTLVTKHLGSGMTQKELENAEKIEQQIDDHRDALKLAARKRIEDGEDIESEILFIDQVQQLEHIGDHSFSIARAIANRK